jgi:3-deoxy-manno-octulosonate cytidylyltransferase (CMP-KDO synthetase)
MVVHTLKRAQLAQAVDDVYVCTDSDEVRDVVRSHGGNVILTRADHTNGTERIAEAARILASGSSGVTPNLIIDVQGDQPLLNPEHLDVIAAAHAEHDDWDILVPSATLTDPDTPHVVKIVKNHDDRILWMSRSVIPHPFQTSPACHLQHLDSICFRPDALQRFAGASPGSLEQVEGVELLRAIEHGMVLGTVMLEGEFVSVNTADDLSRARGLMESDHTRRRY